MKVAAHLTAVSLLLQLCSVIGYNATGDDDYYYAYYDEYDSYYDYYDDYGGESTLGSNSDVFTVVVDDDGTPIMEIVEAVRSLSPADVNASAAAAANFLSAYEDESDGYKEDPEVESKPMRKYGYEKSSIDESRVIEEQLMVGSMRHSVMNDTISMIACIPKHDIRGSRASGTEEMMLIKDIREKEREEDLIFSRRGKLTLKELQDVRLKKRQEESQVKEKMVRKFQPGADCEALACTACELIVEEMAAMVHRSLADKEYPTVDSALRKVCGSKEMQRYNEIVPFLCAAYIMDLPGYREELVRAFDGMSMEDLVKLNEVDSKVNVAQGICVAKFGACAPENYLFSTEKIYRYQEHWSDRCFVCQTAADSIEQRVLMLKRTSDEGHLKAVVTATCDRLRLGDECREMLTGPRVDDFAWIARLHFENVAKKVQSEKRFSDKVCEEIKYCEAWIPDDERKDKYAMDEIEQVFA